MSYWTIGTIYVVWFFVLHQANKIMVNTNNYYVGIIDPGKEWLRCVLYHLFKKVDISGRSGTVSRQVRYIFEFLLWIHERSVLTFWWCRICRCLERMSRGGGFWRWSPGEHYIWPWLFLLFNVYKRGKTMYSKNRRASSSETNSR